MDINNKIEKLNNVVIKAVNEIEYLRDGIDHYKKVLNNIKKEIDQYLIDNEFGTAYRSDIAKIIDKHIY